MNRPRTIVAAAIETLGLLLGMTGCSQEPLKPGIVATADYYPLAVGDQWTYKMSPGKKVYDIDVMETRMIGSTKTYAVAIESSYSFLAKQSGGVYEYGQGEPSNPSSAIFFDPAELRYKMPFAADETWDTPALSEPAKKNSDTVYVSGRCNGFDTVTVPAGTFAQCAHVIIDDPRDTPEEQTEMWFAPNVGIVKTITYLTIGIGKPKPITTELTKFKLVLEGTGKPGM